MIFRAWLLIALCLGAQTASAFDINAYRDFLDQNENADYATLRDRHIPDPRFLRDLALDTSGATYLQDIIDAYALTPDELELLAENGFVVTERMKRETYGQLLNSAWTHHLPLYVSSDVILHGLHVSFVTTLKTIESDYAFPTLVDALAAVQQEWPALASQHSADSRMQVCLDDLDVWITVARSLLEGAPVPAGSPTNQSFIAEILTAIENENPTEFALFNEDPRWIDFSQFKPRGYYDDTVTLRRYFKCMMWLGRVDFRLSIPPGLDAPDSVQREVVDAFLARELTNMAGVRSSLAELDDILRLFVGESDNTTLAQLDVMTADLGLTQANSLWDEGTYSTFEDLLASNVYQPQAINSRILFADPMSGEPMNPPYAFLLMGQRFTVDSYVCDNVVYSEVPFPFRGLPSPLDVLYALGNNSVIPLLEPELEAYPYAPNLAAVRYLVDSYDEEFWSASVYNLWLSAIRELNATGHQDGAPDFMKTGAWQQKEMQTQLTSWTELRHDTILHVKQPYTDGVICGNPYGYIEPVPELYARVGQIARMIAEQIGPALPADYLHQTRWIVPFWTRVDELAAALETIARKELAHEALTEDEELFLREAYAMETEVCGGAETGWLADFYLHFMTSTPMTSPDFVVADVHTQPTDEFGGMVGNVLHVGTVHPRICVVIAGCPYSEPIAYVGAVGSMRQYVTNDFLRLTDDDWSYAFTGNGTGDWWLASQILGGSWAPWERVYTADTNGLRRNGPTILNAYGTAIEDPGEDPGPPPAMQPGIQWLTNAPNPFNPSTQIGFQIAGTEPVPVRVAIYDTRGALVRVLMDDTVQPNTWFLHWDGTDVGGGHVGSGVYFAVLTTDGGRAVRKMVMVR